MNNLHPIIRWIIFIPASLLLGGITYYVISLAHAIYPAGGLAQYLNQLLAAGISGGMAIHIAHFIAPNFKKRVIIGYVIAAFLLLVVTLLIVPISEYGIMENLRYASQNIGIFGWGWYLYEEEKREEKLTL